MDKQHLVDAFIQMRPLAHARWQTISDSRDIETPIQFFADLLFPKLVVFPNSHIANLFDTSDAEVSHAKAIPVVIRRACLNESFLENGESSIDIIQLGANLGLQLAIHSPSLL